MPVLVPQGVQPEAAAQVAADVRPADVRQAQGAQMVVEFQHQRLPVAVVAPEALQVQLRGPQEILAQQALPPQVHWGRPLLEERLVLQPARQELAAQ